MIKGNRNLTEDTRRMRSMEKKFTKDYLLVSLIPVVLMIVLVVTGSFMVRRYLADMIQEATFALNDDAELHLQHLGEGVIRGKARDVARQVEVFLRANPGVQMARLQSDGFFKKIAYQKVGETGYTCLYEVPTATMYIHPNPDLINYDMKQLADKLPSWWAIFEPTLKGEEVSGYYDWLEPDNTKRKKYMTMTPVGTKYNGKTLMIAATTYIDEFSAPMVTMRSKAGEIVKHYERFISEIGFLIGGATALVFILTFSGVYILGRRAALGYINPIRALAEAAGELGSGKWRAVGRIDGIRRDDEIGALARAFKSMSEQLSKLFADLESRVAELKQTQKALMQSESHYKGLFNGVPLGLYRTAPDGVIQDANPTFVEMFGYPNRETILAVKAEQFYIDAEDRKRWKRQMEGEKAARSFEAKMRRYDGSVIWVEIYARSVRDTAGAILYFEGSLKNVTERKNAETALKKSEENYRQLYDESRRAEELYSSLIHSSADAVVIYDMEGKAQYVSPVFTDTFQWTLEDVKGERIPFLPESEVAPTMAIIRALVEEGTPCQGFETTRLTKDGRLIDVSISASRYDDHEGKPAGMLAILRDRSEKKRLESQLRHAERMKAIGTLAGGVAHDFNNLLMGIQGNISIMLCNMDPAHPHYRKFKNIETQIRNGSRLTSQLLGYAKKGKYWVKLLDLNQTVHTCVETFRRNRKGITVHSSFTQDPLPVEVDEVQIEQVLMNLFSNAADAMPHGGDLFLETSVIIQSAEDKSRHNLKPGRYARVDVRDTGVGMDKDIIEHMFDPFFTTKEMGHGTGLGLASAYGIIKSHKGHIYVDSGKDHGTTFSIYLPAKEEEVVAVEKEKQHTAKNAHTILLVDDEEMIIDIGVQMLEFSGYRVLTAENGAQAVECFKENMGTIDLVVLDMMLPDMSGGEVYGRLTAIAPDVKVLLSSGYSLDDQVKEVLDRGVRGFIQKPFGLEEFSRKVKELLYN